MRQPGHFGLVGSTLLGEGAALRLRRRPVHKSYEGDKQEWKREERGRRREAKARRVRPRQDVISKSLKGQILSAEVTESRSNACPSTTQCLQRYAVCCPPFCSVLSSLRPMRKPCCRETRLSLLAMYDAHDAKEEKRQEPQTTTTRVASLVTPTIRLTSSHFPWSRPPSKNRQHRG